MKFQIAIISVFILAIALFSKGCCCLPRNDAALRQDDEEPAVTKLREYLRFQSAHPEPEEGYEQVISWLEKQSQEIGLNYNLVDLEEPSQFVVLMTWPGSDPSLQSILLNSHVDVVPAEPEKWEHHPYEGLKDENGNIYGRGAVDMKSATVAELEAIRKLKSSGFQPLRTIHLTMMPDEEAGGRRGVRPFLTTEQFKNMNVGIDIDEGFPTGEDDLVHITYAEKTVWQFTITARGEASHASNLPQYTAGQRLQVVIDRLMAYRESEYQKLQTGNATMDEVTSINLTLLGGGTADNIIPNEVWATFDMRIRLRPGWNYTDVEDMLEGVLAEASLGSGPGEEVFIEYSAKYTDSRETVANDSSVWWRAVQTACTEMGLTCKPHVFNAVTDGRWVRGEDVPVFGICPFPNTPNTAHQVDEYINEVEFLRGIDRYATIIRNLAMVPVNATKILNMDGRL